MAKKRYILRAALLVAATLPAAALLFPQGMASRGAKPAARAKPSGLPWMAPFRDIAEPAGLTKPVIYGGAERTSYLVETSSGGVALVDYDGDGWLDVLLVGGSLFEGTPPAVSVHLYRNRRDGTFSDETTRAGLRFQGWGSGVAVGDYDNDGHLDLFITSWGPNCLYRNRGDGTFEDVTAEAGLSYEYDPRHPRWNSGATFVDYDRDGDLDLFIAAYASLDLRRVPKPGANPYCHFKGIPVACGPRGLPTASPLLYRNEGNGRFVDVSVESGVASAAHCFGMTAVAADLTGDGWPDVAVACDSTPSLLFVNRRDGTFSEEGLERGIALSEDGEEQAGMGLALGDWDRDGWLDIAKTHLVEDTHGLWRNDGKGFFTDVTLASGLGVQTRYTGWGAGLEDFDNDGWPDLFIATGHIYPDTERALPGYPVRTPPLLFRNLGNGRLEELIEEGGPGLAASHAGRGCAFGDLDNDGDVDIVVMNRNERPTVLRNDFRGGRNWLQITLRGKPSNRAAIGATVIATYGGKPHAQAVLSQSSFYSASDLRRHFGLGAERAADVEIRWPSGYVQKLRGVAANHWLWIEEGEPPRPMAAQDP